MALKLESERLLLRPLQPSDVTTTYLAWLNDTELQRYTRRRGITTTMDDLKSFVNESHTSDDVHLAIVIKEQKLHIGNIFLNHVDRLNLCADLSIMIGEKNAHGKGFAQEAIALLTAHAFTTMKLHRLYACSPNIAFNGMIRKLGWKHEGTRRESFLLDGTFLDIDCWALLSDEFNDASR